jgi:hypothetical protein
MRNAELALIEDLSPEWLAAQSPPSVLTAAEIEARRAVISGELFKLRVAYPTQARNYSDGEVAAMNALWSEIFIAVEPRLLHEAIIRFITGDRKAFFPSPGQIVGQVERIIAEKEEERKRISYERERVRLREYDDLIREGKHCGTCRHCSAEYISPEHDDPGYMKWRFAKSEEERLSLRIEKLFCENPASYYHKGECNWGTTNESGVNCTSRKKRRNELETK